MCPAPVGGREGHEQAGDTPEVDAAQNIMDTPQVDTAHHTTHT